MKTVTVNSHPLDLEITTHIPQSFPPLEQVNSPTVPTAQAAYYLNRESQTLRAWACLENGPLRPVRIYGRLAWPVNAIRSLLNGGL